jgi:hypothetical protein
MRCDAAPSARVACAKIGALDQWGAKYSRMRRVFRGTTAVNT